MPSSTARFGRNAYYVVSLLLVASVLVTVYLAGMSIFVSPVNWATHAIAGSVVGLVFLLQLLTAFVGRIPRAMAILLGIVFLDYVVQGLLPGFRDVVPLLAAVHPANALVVFALALLHASRARELARESRPAAEVTSLAEATEPASDERKEAA